MSWKTPMINLAWTASSASFKIRLANSLVGAIDVTVSLTNGTYRHDLTTNAGLIGHVLTRANAAEIAAGTNGTWTADQPAGLYRAQVRLKRAPGDASDNVTHLREFTTGLQTLLGMGSSPQTPTSGGGVPGDDVYWDTLHLGYVWTPDRHPHADHTHPVYGGAFAHNGAGYGALIVDRATTRRDVRLEMVWGGLVLSDLLVREQGYLNVSGLTVNDTNAPLEVLWSVLLGGGSASPNDTLRYYPDRDTPGTYQDVRIADAGALLDPVGSQSWREQDLSPSRWAINFPFTARSD